VTHAAPAGFHERRLAYVRALRPERVVAARWSWQTSPTGDVQGESLTLDAAGVTRVRPNGGSRIVSLDDAFVYGPPAPGMPRAAREQLRSALRAALDPATESATDPGFVELDHAAIVPGVWTHDLRTDGQSDVRLDGGAVEMGYRYGHDQGSDTYAVERVWSGAPDVYWTAPATIRDEVLGRIAAARVDAPSRVAATGRPTYRELSARAEHRFTLWGPNSGGGALILFVDGMLHEVAYGDESRLPGGEETVVASYSPREFLRLFGAATDRRRDVVAFLLALPVGD
jgi:hypothetical protein